MAFGTNFAVDNSGKLFASNIDIAGKVVATEGKIAEYTISGAKLVGTEVGLSGKSGDGWAFWAGNDTPSSAPFHVGHDGKMRLKSYISKL